MALTLPQEAGRSEDKNLDAVETRMVRAVLVDVEAKSCHTPAGVKNLDSRGPSAKQVAIGRVVHNARVRADLPLKHFGDEGRMSRVESGELVPKWLERACEHKVMLRWMAVEALMAVGFRKRTSLEGDGDIGSQEVA